MALFAARGTSLFMTILIWFLGLFGINIGGKDDPIQQAKEYYFIPEGASLVMEDQTIQGPDKLDKDIKLKDGTVYTYGDYAYTKNLKYWDIKVIDRTKTSYEPVIFKTQIVDKDLNVLKTENHLFGLTAGSMFGCYKDCINLIEAPSIPKECESLSLAFRNCQSLTTPPKVNGNPVMYYTFEGCDKLEFPDGYHITFDEFYLNYRADTNSWKFVQQPADSQNGFTEKNVSRILSFLDYIDYKYSGRDIDVNQIKLIDENQNVLLLKPVPSDPTSAYFVIQYVNDEQYEAAIKYWDTKGNKCCGSYKVVAYTMSIEEICVLSFVPETSSSPAHYRLTEQNASASEIIDTFSRTGFQKDGFYVDLSGLKQTLSFVGDNGKNVVDLCLTNVSPNYDYSCYEWSLWSVYIQEGTAEDVFKFFSEKSFSYLGFNLRDFEGFTIEDNQIEFRFRLNSPSSKSYWIAKPTGNCKNSTFLDTVLNYYNTNNFLGYPVYINGFTTEDDYIRYRFVQPDTQTFNGSYWVVEPTDNCKDYEFLDTVLNYYNTKKFLGYPVYINGFTTEDNYIRYRFVQPDTQTFNGSYWAVEPTGKCKDGEFLDIVLNHYRKDYFYSRPVYIDGFTTNDGYVRFRFVQPDTQTFTGSYWVAEPMGNCKDDEFLHIVLSIYSKDYFYGVPVYINGFTTNDGYVRFRFVQPDTQTFTGSYWFAEPMGEISDEEFSRIISERYGGYLENYPIHTGPILAY